MAKKVRDVDDLLEKPVPTSGTKKKTIDVVLGLMKTGNGALSLLTGLLAAAMILYSGYVLYDNFATEYRAYSSTWDLLKYKPEIINDNDTPLAGGDTLASINADYRAWLTIYDSTIDYPVVQGENNLYYANHDIYGSNSFTGAIYLSYDNAKDFSDAYNIVYGHHMDNGAMFGVLDRFRDEAFYKSHREGVIVTRSGVYDLTTFAVVETDAYETKIYSVGNRADAVKKFLTGSRAHDMGLGTTVLYYDHDVADTADHIIALSTCASGDTNGRLVVFARMVRRDLPSEITPEPDATPTPTPRRTATPTPEVPVATPTPRVSHTPLPTYTPNPGPFKVTIRYLFLTGGTAAPEWSDTLMTGESYSRKNPVIEGYVTARSSVSGVMGSRDILITVLYVPEELAGNGALTSIEDYNVPLGLDDPISQKGLCVE